MGITNNGKAAKAKGTSQSLTSYYDGFKISLKDLTFKEHDENSLKVFITASRGDEGFLTAVFYTSKDNRPASDSIADRKKWFLSQMLRPSKNPSLWNIGWLYVQK